MAPLLICSVTFEPSGAPTNSLTTVILPVSRDSVLFVVTSTVAFLTAIVTVADGENDGVPNVYPSGGDGRLGSLTVHCVPVGIPLIVCERPPAFNSTDPSPVCAASHA